MLIFFPLLLFRYEAVPLVDAFDIHDDILNSCLGRYDGDVYRHLYQWALRAPRNKKEVLACIHIDTTGIICKKFHKKSNFDWHQLKLSKDM